MNFVDLLRRAKENDNEARTAILEMYQPMLLKESILDGVFDEDLYQELCVTLLQCVDRFQLH